MPVSIPPTLRNILQDKAYAHVITRNSTGSPQVSMTWIDAEGDEVLINTNDARTKVLNLKRDPRIVVSVQDRNSPQAYAIFYGKAKTIVDDVGNAHIDKMAKRFLGLDKYVSRVPGEKRVIIRVSVDKIGGFAPGYQPWGVTMAIKTYGTMAVDWENRIDFDRLRRERLARIKDRLAKSELGALLCFDMNNVRYITSTHIGTWAQDKVARFTLLPQKDEPILWDFGSAARHHQQNCPWLGERSRAGIGMLRGAMTPEMGRAEDVAKKIKIELEKRGLHKEPLGIDVIEPPILFALQREGITVVDGQPLLSDAREIKTQDEISLLTHSAGMVDAAYHELYMAMKPGMRENEAVGLVNKILYDAGSEYVEGVNAISGERCSPHPHVFSDRVMRPGDPAYYDILHSYMGYRTCYYRTFSIGYAPHAMVDAYKRCRDYLDAAIELIRPGRTTAEVAAVWPKAQEFGFPNEEAAFALQYGHGVGVAIWEKPVISRLVSLDHPHEFKPGMVFALETFWPCSDGWRAARIEEEVVVTATGHEVITRFPAEELLVAGATYVTVNGPLSTTREDESTPNREVVQMIAAAAKGEKVGATR